MQIKYRIKFLINFRFILLDEEQDKEIDDIMEVYMDEVLINNMEFIQNYTNTIIGFDNDLEIV